MGDGKALNEEERAALNTAIAIVQALDSPVRGTDWTKVLDLAQRALCYGFDGATAIDESRKEALKRFMRDVGVYRVADNALGYGAACRCAPCTQQRAARAARIN